MLEGYYQHFTGKTGTLRGWNDYSEALTKIREKGEAPLPSEKTISELDQMRVYDRNPIMHPRIVLTETDALVC